MHGINGPGGNLSITPVLAANGMSLSYVVGIAGNGAAYNSSLYTVQDIDNANTLNITGIGASLVQDLRDMSIGGNGNQLSLAPVGGEGLDLSAPTIMGMDIRTPIPSAAIAGLSADKASYGVGDTITVTMTDNADSRFSAWLRNTVDTQNGNVLGGAYIAVRNNDGGLDTYPLAVSGDSGASVMYSAQIPADLYAPCGSGLQIALFYSNASNNNPVTRDAATGVFSGGQLDLWHLLSVGLTQPNYVTAVSLDAAAYPAGNTIHIGGYTRPSR